MLLLNLDDQRNGVAIIDGVSYRVIGTYGTRYYPVYPPTAERQALTIELTLNATLDEEQQQKRITKLEYQLAEERERLEEIRKMITGEAVD